MFKKTPQVILMIRKFEKTLFKFDSKELRPILKPTLHSIAEWTV